MNVKLITKALHTLSLLSDEDYDLVLKFRALTEDERGLLMTVLEPEKPAAKKAITERKIEHCVACDYTKRALVHKDPNADGYHEFQSAKSEKKSSKSSSSKSPRATGIEQQLKSRVSEQREAPRTTTAIDDMTMEIVERCTDCGAESDDNVHHKRTDANYHPFVSVAPPAPARSPANGGAESIIQNSVDGTDDAGIAANAGG